MGHQAVSSDLGLTPFRVVGIDLQGSIQSTNIVAATPENAREDASALGLTVLRCEPASRRSTRRMDGLSFVLKPGKRTSMDTVTFAQDLSTLLVAGVTIKESIHALAMKERISSRRAVLAQLDKSVSEGLTFSSAMRFSGAFPELLVATVAASEQTGDLATGLFRYANHQQSLRAVRDRVVGASVYPLLLLAVGTIVIALLLGVVVPKFATLIEVNGRELPFLSRLLMDWGQFVDAHPSYALAMFAAFSASVGAAVVRMRNPAVRRKWLERIPGFARLAREFQHLQMYRTTAILTSRGITINKALHYSMDLLSPSDQLRLQSALQSMQEGVEISKALSSSGLSDAIATSMLNVAERTGSLAEMLDRTADFYERSLQRNIDIVSRLIEPVMMIIFGLLVGGIVILMYLPIFDLASSFS
jgi:general secretion pathway protein F